MSVEASRDAEEQSLIRELATTSYKYSEPPTSNKLTHLRDLTSFLTKLRLVFNRFPGVSKIMYATVGATNSNVDDFTVKSLPERSIVKAEPGTAKPPSEPSVEEAAILQILSEKKFKALKSELEVAGPVTNMKEFRAFMEDSDFDEVIDENLVLLHYVAPFLKGGSQSTTPSTLSILEKHRSLEYERPLAYWPNRSLDL